MFGAFVVKKWHFPPESPEFRRKVAEFRRKVAEFRPEFPEFRFLNLNSPSVRKMRFSAEFRPEFRFRWSAGFVKKRKGEPWVRLVRSAPEPGADPTWGQGGWSPPYPHRSFGAPLKPPQQFLNLDEEEEGEERRKKKRKKEKRKKKGKLSPPPLIF